jgi:hypothetical protein
MGRDRGRERSGRERMDGDEDVQEEAEEEVKVHHGDKGGALALGSIC